MILRLLAGMPWNEKAEGPLVVVDNQYIEEGKASGMCSVYRLAPA